VVKEKQCWLPGRSWQTPSPRRASAGKQLTNFRLKQVLKIPEDPDSCKKADTYQLFFFVADELCEGEDLVIVYLNSPSVELHVRFQRLFFYSTPVIIGIGIGEIGDCQENKYQRQTDSDLEDLKKNEQNNNNYDDGENEFHKL
jgi:hypothetical protein